MKHASHTTRALLAGLLIVAMDPAFARPGTPTGVHAEALAPTEIRVGYVNTADKYEPVSFEFEQKINGVRAPRHVEAALSQGAFKSGTGDGWYPDHAIVAKDLIPETEYCFRVWSRDEDGYLSEKPSGWACARTPSHPPLAPLDVQVALASDLDTTPRISWSTPDQADHRGITRFIIERQTSPVPGRPWVVEATVPGPAGEQTASTQLAFAVEGARIDPYAKQLYRICSENSGGRSKWVNVELVPPRKLEQSAGTTARDLPPIEVAPKPVPLPNATIAAQTSVSAGSRYREPNSAAPSAVATATAAAAETTRVNPAGNVALNPQPLPPRNAERTTHTAVNPAGDVALNPQPLPPKTTVLAPRSPTVISSAPMQTRDATSAVNPQTQIQGTSRALGGQAIAEAEVATVQLICRGGDSLRFESKGPKQNAGGGSSALMWLYFGPAYTHKNAQGNYPAAGPEGTGLVPSSCSYADREFMSTDPQGIMFETALHSSEGEVKRQLHDAEPGRKKDPTTLAEVRPNEQNIPLYLSKPGHYWSFTGYRTNYGHFVATANGYWKPKSTIAIAGTVGTNAERDSQLTVGRLMNIKVIPELRGVGFRFVARPDASPLVAIGREQPVRGTNGTWVIGSPLTLQTARDPKASSATVTTYAGASGPQNLTLEPATRYHYVITVPAGTTAAMAQQTGSFRTLTRTAKVIFTGIHVLNDSDDETDGDLTFGFFANAREPSAVSKRWDEQTWASGPRRRIDERLVVPNAPDRLRIVVSVYDDDKSQADICTRLSLEPDDFNALRPRRNKCGEVNFAKAEIDLSKPSPTGGSFTLNSFGLGPHSTLLFSVSGYVEVSYTQ